MQNVWDRSKYTGRIWNVALLPQIALRRLGKLFSLVIAALFAVTQSVLPAFATSGAPSCIDIPLLTQTVTAGFSSSTGSDTSTNTVGIHVGDMLVFTHTIGAGGGSLSILVTASPGGVDNGSVGTSSSSGTVSFYPTASGTYTFVYDISGSGPFIVNFSATCSGKTPSTPATGDKQDATDVAVGLLDLGRLNNSPVNLPAKQQDPENFDQDSIAVVERIEAIEARLDELFQILFAGDNEIKSMRSRGVDPAEVDKLVDELILSVDEQSALEKELGQLKFELLDDLGDGEVLLYQATANTDPVSEAFNAITALGNGVETSNILPGVSVDVWSRLKLAFIQGSLNRRGVSLNGEVGFVRSITDDLDAGMFMSFFAGNVANGPLSTTLNTMGIGAGGYAKLSLPNGLETGLSASFERSSNNINIGGTTGTFIRDRLEVDYSLSGTYNVGGARVVPVVNLGWIHTQRQSYVDSSSATVAGGSGDEVTTSAGISIDRTFVVNNGKVLSVTPSVGGAVNFNLVRRGDVTFSSGTIAQSLVTGDINAGVTARLIGGGSLGFSAGVAGIGDSAQAYSATVKLTGSLN